MTRLVCLGFVAVIVACVEKTAENASDSSMQVTARAAVPQASPATPAVKPACPHTGRWALCNVEQRLKQSGFVAKRVSASPEKRAGFSVTPAVYSIGKDSHLELFIYPDEKSLSKDVAKLDTLRVTPIGGTPVWNGTPTFIRSANLVGVFLSDNPRQIERLSLAITAGPPQPGSGR